MSDKPRKKKSPSKELLAWLNDQATKLRNLVTRGWKLQTAFLQNAKEQGNVLAEVHEGLKGTDMGFDEWVKEYTDIGVSTAYLWKDVAEWWPQLEAWWNSVQEGGVSNPLEFSIRQIRDQIRDLKQAQGIGKPGSGRRKATDTATPPSAEDVSTDTDEAPTADPGDQEDVTDAGPGDAPDIRRWEREVAKAEAEAAEVEGGSKSEPETPLYKVTVMVFTEADQEAIQQALSNWSPISKIPVGTKQFRSVAVHAQPPAIGAVLEKLGQALEQSQPKKVRVSIEL